MHHFRRELLPPPRTFYERELGKLGRPSRDWSQVSCPFHRPDKHPSFSVNLSSGGFLCFSCGARGGNVVDFLIQRDGISFKAAALQLGAWVHDSRSVTDRQELARLRRQRQSNRDRAARLAEAERQLRLEYRETIHAMERIVHETQERLRGHQLTSGDHEICGDVFKMALAELREAISAYFLLSFGAAAERADFILHPDAAITVVMLRGTLRDDCDRLLEVTFP
jgi:hypothetical protein